MKTKHLKSFRHYQKVNENTETKFNSNNFDTELKIDVSEIVDYFLADLQLHCDEKNIDLSEDQVETLVKSFIDEELNFTNKMYYTAKDHYESADVDDKFFDANIKKVE